MMGKRVLPEEMVRSSDTDDMDEISQTTNNPSHLSSPLALVSHLNKNKNWYLRACLKNSFIFSIPI